MLTPLLNHTTATTMDVGLTASGRRRKRLLLLATLLLFIFAWSTCWRLAELTSEALMPPPPPQRSLDHFRRTRSMSHYLDNIQLLIEPSLTPCTNVEEIPVIIMVTSAPSRHPQRHAVRRTWAQHQPTYFVLGQTGTDGEDWLADNYLEAKQYGDMVVYDFTDDYQNLTLKTALMMQWTLQRCPHAHFMLKTDDDVLINPWTLATVLKENADAQLLGYKFSNRTLHRDQHSKWYSPRWLWPEDIVAEYLTGSAYLISGEYLDEILQRSHEVPLINMEDVYFTYLVAKRSLGLTLTHNRRVSAYKPWLSWKCVYWSLATAHSLAPDEMVTAWLKIEDLKKTNTTQESCSFFERYLSSDLLLY